MDYGGFYASLIRSQLGDVEETGKEENLVLTDTSSDDDDGGDNKIYVEDNKKVSAQESDLPIKPCVVIKELLKFKLNLVIAITAACVLGYFSPINGYIMGEGIKGLDSKHRDVRFDSGLK